MICSQADYRRITGDYESYDGYVDTALVAAQSVFEQRTRRFFEEDDRTETLTVKRDGSVYPHALPITVVTSPASLTIQGTALNGYAWWLDPTINWTGDWPYYTRDRRPQVVVTYTGGYADDEMPAEVKSAVAELAASYLTPTPASLVPAGATSVRVGDVQVQGDYLNPDAIPATVRAAIKKWKRREI